jgi:hypothetical protein
MEFLPLNPSLYRRLGEVFGEVKIANQGVACSVQPTTTREHQMIVGGEYYRVNCPFCAMRNMHDLRQRLWIHHRWGVGAPGDTQTYDDFRWTAHYSEGNVHRRRRMTSIFEGKQYDTRLNSVPYPGRCINIDQLPSMHDAVTYMTARGFDPVQLTHEYGVKYCEHCDGENWMATGRIIFPIVMDGKMVTWQGRYVGKADWRQIPKYYTGKFTHKGQCLFNFDKAKPYRFVIVCEGPTDAIAIGKNAVAIMGKSLSDPQFILLSQHWDMIVLCIDGEAYEESEMMYERLRGIKPVVRVQLPDKADPASMIHQDPDYFYQLLDGVCRSAGYDLLAL